MCARLVISSVWLQFIDQEKERKCASNGLKLW